MKPEEVAPIGKGEMVRLATTEYRRLLALLDDLDASDWDRPTDCDEWTVKQIVAHLLGVAEANASMIENQRQLLHGRRIAQSQGTAQVDGVNRFQVETREHLEPSALRNRLGDIAPAAVRGRRRTPRPLRGIKVPDPTGGVMTLGFLVDVVYTRDQWMHRIDLARATDRPLELTPDHDGRIVADVVRQLAREQAEPVNLELTGPAGGTFIEDERLPPLKIDAVEFCRALSGRRSSAQVPSGLLRF